MQKLQFTSVITQFLCTKVGCHSKINVVPNTADEAVQMWFSHIQTWWRLCWLNNFRYARSLNFMSVLWWGPVLSAHGGIQILYDRGRELRWVLQADNMMEFLQNESTRVLQWILRSGDTWGGHCHWSNEHVGWDDGMEIWKGNTSTGWQVDKCW